MSTTWRNRIVATAEVDPASLTEHPMNWRVHPKNQRDTVEDALDKIGWIQTVVVNRTSGRMIDGHLRIASAIRRGITSVPVSYVELSEAEEKAALASLDPMSAMAVMDGEKLTELLKDLEFGGGALDAMFDELREQAEGSTLAAASKNPEGLLTKGAPVVKAVIAVADINLVERALAASGALSRGEALLDICRVYLFVKKDGNEKGQHDAEPKGGVTLEPLEANPKTDSPRDARGNGASVETGVQRNRPRRGVRRKTRKG
jgi:ParB-like chromosome segregation protein Spo0J